MRRIGRRRAAVVGAILALVPAASAWAAFQQLPPGGQVAGGQVSVEDPANSDVTGGSLAGGAAVPWAVFRQKTVGHDQIFGKSFAGGAWTLRGTGTVGGRSSASTSGSLNFDQGVDGEAPSIDFAGAGRTVPWATWYEDTTGFAAENIFASRFDQAQDKWVFAGQGRGLGGGSVNVPSLNIHTTRDAENPSVAGGATVAGNAPVPWVTWQEVDGGATGPQQIFVSKAVKPATGTTCPDDGPRPNKPLGGNAIGGFCWQQVGLDRVDPTTGASSATGDPSLDVDPRRDGIEPDIAFTGAGDTVPWVVWYEVSDLGHGGTPGLHTNDLVFAAKATPNAAADGQFGWTAVGTTGAGVLDTTGPTHAFGACAESADAEASCSLNANPDAGAVDPRVAAGTMTPGNATVPWVAWEEASGGHERIFVSRLVGSGAAARFALANGGQPLPTLVGGIDATRPDITFSGNTPYLTWHEGTSVVSGHFTTPDGFVIDNAAVGSDVSAGVRAPISSGCTANPFNGDGSSCQAGAVGTPFFLFTENASTTPMLLADAYQTDAPVTGAPTAVGSTAATVTGTVNPQGAPVVVQFQFGATTAYGQTTTAQRLGPANAPVAFSAVLSGLPASTTIHYRAVAVTDFGAVAGPDRTLTTTASPPPPKDKTPPHLRITIVKTTIKALLKTKKLKVRTRVDEAAKVRLSARARGRALGKARVTFKKSGSKTVSLKVTKSALRRLRPLRRVTVAVTGKATDRAGNTSRKKATRTLRRR
jgi:hypothetical protein